MNKRQIIFTVLTILWMITIFLFSAKEGEESEEMSNGVGMFVCDLFISDFDEWTREEQEALALKIDYPIRKLAHMCEYALLSLLLSGAIIREFNSLKIKKLLPVLVVGIAYAATDEIHQLFVPGRSGKVSDVLVDTSGMVVALMLLYLVCRIRSNKNLKTKQF